MVLGATGEDVTVAVIDSGISGHEDFQAVSVRASM